MSIDPNVLAAVKQEIADAHKNDPLLVLIDKVSALLDQAIADASAIQASLQSQLDDLNRQVAAAQLALTADQLTLANVMAVDATKIADLTVIVKSLTDANATLTADNARLTALLAAATTPPAPTPTPIPVPVPPPGTIDPVADFAARIADPGVFFRENFSYPDLAAAASHATNPRFYGSSTGNPPDPNIMSLSVEHALSGKSLRIKYPPNSGASGNSWLYSFDPNNGIQVPFAGVPHDDFYFQIIVWGDQQWTFPFKMSDGSAASPKVLIVDHHDSSSNAGEVVLTNDHMKGLVAAYLGFTKSSGSELIGGGFPSSPWNIAAHTVVTFHINAASNRVRMWAAKYGQAPVLIGDTSISIPGLDMGRPGGYPGFQLTPFITDNANAGGASQPTTFIDYCEIIASKNPISFPGGFALPSAVITLPVVIPPAPIPTPIPVPIPAPAGSSALARAAATIVPGQMLDFPVPGLTGLSGPSSPLYAEGPSTKSIITFAARGLWDAKNKKIQFAGVSHTGGVVTGGAGGLLTYDEATNKLTKTPYAWSSDVPSHSYYHVAIDPAGNLYYRLAGSGAIWKLPAGSTTWQTTAIAPNPNNANQFDSPLTFFPELNGSAGGLVFADALGVSWTNAALSSWKSGPQDLGGIIGNYDTWGAAAGGFVYFGGGNGSNAMFRLDPNGTRTRLANVPVDSGPNNHRYSVIAHPNRVDLLALPLGAGAGALWRYDAKSDSWISGSSITVNSQFTIATSIPDYGVVVFWLQEGSGGLNRCKLYKP